VSISLDELKAERDKLKEGLRELESEQRKLEGDLKSLRQREVRAKREIEALGTLIELSEARGIAADAAAETPRSSKGKKPEEATAR
jgi:predicted nuclease with TOPRIM domain